MRAGFGLAFLTLLCQPVVAQTEDPCRADVRHLKLPDRAFIDDVLGLGQPPIELLFTKDGVDVYSATDFKAMQVFQRNGMPLANAFTIILVYQDEKLRQQKIESLRKQYRHAPLDNLKFATVRFELTPVWDENVLKRKWLIAGFAYFKPVSCEPPESRMPASSQGYLEATINGHNTLLGIGMPPATIPESQRQPVLIWTQDAIRSQAARRKVDCLGHGEGPRGERRVRLSQTYSRQLHASPNDCKGSGDEAELGSFPCC